MLHLYLVTYDIRDEKRLRRVYKKMRGFGDHLQYSVFRCELSEANLVRMKMALNELIDHDADQVLIFRLGPLDGIYTLQVEALGTAYIPSDHEAVVV